MGGSTYDKDEHAARSSFRAATGTPVFKHDADIRAGTVKAGVDPRMNPKGVNRESRDSAEHPVTLPIALFLDTTGSMAGVPVIIERELSKLMGHFLNDKASGKKYLGDAYPAILIGAVDDFDAQVERGLYNGDGCLQVGQFESGIEIDNDLERIWLTRNGGGTYHESYQLAMYFAARHTVHDNWERRGRKGYMFIIGDEHAYPAVKPKEVERVMGDSLEAPIPLAKILAEVKERYHVFFILPALTSYYNDEALRQYWQDLLGQQNIIKLADPEKICEAIVSCVAIMEEHVGLADLLADGVATGIDNALVPLARSVTGVAKVSAANLPTVAGTASEVERL